MTAVRRLCALIVSIVAFATIAPAKSIAPPPPEGDKPLIQIAILLDTSGSMSGLINQARTQLWTVVNEFARSKQSGQTPMLQVALYEYGNSNLAASEGYIRMILPLTDDLDAVSEKLFALTTNGGDEYCGHVIQSATKGLAWSASPKVYRAIFIAGNEPFTQGTVDYRQSCAEAIAKGIIVNTIHCGPQAVGDSSGWADGAKLADGRAMNIDQDKAVVAIAAPQDEAILKLSAELNKTYVAYGAEGRDRAVRQEAQDALAAAAPEAGSGVQRSVSKAQSVYRNAGWDLVDASKGKEFKIESVDAKDLPENMRSMTPEQRKAYVEEQAKKRSEVQAKINDLNQQREKFVAAKQKEAAGADTLDAAMLTAVREQLGKKEFEVERK
ncbi:MAG: vWA domain-containing protein [Tepidisphaeraceae bacterium]